MYHEAIGMIKEILGLPNIISKDLHPSLLQRDHGRLQRNAMASVQGTADKLAACHIHIPIRHMANSGAVLNFPNIISIW